MFKPYDDTAEASVATHKLMLEAMVDRQSLTYVLNLLSEISEEKEEHVASNWQDRQLALAWRRKASILSRTANLPAIQQV